MHVLVELNNQAKTLTHINGISSAGLTTTGGDVAETTPLLMPPSTTRGTTFESTAGWTTVGTTEGGKTTLSSVDLTIEGLAVPGGGKVDGGGTVMASGRCESTTGGAKTVDGAPLSNNGDATHGLTRGTLNDPAS